MSALRAASARRACPCCRTNVPTGGRRAASGARRGPAVCRLPVGPRCWPMRSGHGRRLRERGCPRGTGGRRAGARRRLARGGARDPPGLGDRPSGCGRRPCAHPPAGSPRGGGGQCRAGSFSGRTLRCPQIVCPGGARRRGTGKNRPHLGRSGGRDARQTHGGVFVTLLPAADQAPTLHVGRIPFLVCAPSFHASLAGFPSTTFTDGPPRRLNALLASGTIDCAPSSSFEYARHASAYVLLPGLCTSGRGEVKSVLLFSRVPWENLDGGRVLLSPDSDTSN